MVLIRCTLTDISLDSIRATPDQSSMRLLTLKSKRHAISKSHRSTKRSRLPSDWQVHTPDKVQADHRNREREQVRFRRATI